jgi:hypothetical protein
LLLLAAGCSGRVVRVTSAAVSHAEKALALDAVRVDGQVQVVVVANHITASGASSGQGTVQGRFDTQNKGEIPWSCGFSRDESGIMINGKPFDHAQGGLFLIDTRAAPASVEQIKLDPADLELSSTIPGLEQLGKDEPRVAAFLEKCKEAKMP